MATKLEGGGGKTLVAGPLKNTVIFFATSLTYYGYMAKKINIMNIIVGEQFGRRLVEVTGPAPQPRYARLCGVRLQSRHPQAG